MAVVYRGERFEGYNVPKRARDQAMRKAWYARHGDTLKGATVFDPIYWAAKVKW